MAGLVPAISLRMAHYISKRDARDKPGHDGGEGVSRAQRSTKRSGVVRCRTGTQLSFEPGSRISGAPLTRCTASGTQAFVYNALLLSFTASAST